LEKNFKYRLKSQSPQAYKEKVTGHEGPEVDSSTLSLTSALEGGGWSTP